MLEIIGNNISLINDYIAFPSRHKQRYPHSKKSHLNEKVSKSNYLYYMPHVEYKKTGRNDYYYWQIRLCSLLNK